ncbi:hypothetical protein L1987_09115 [Smallanthus sonchifolius]|uniref:Uncharacterized protein n=1 Tax=Smallanthus sonchifolius TaxID=185202 RepID=A0ACB9JPP7_9ASTR|nr:hypothetical protein L1987_09115 [Smallanthus sonchifolius]
MNHGPAPLVGPRPSGQPLDSSPSPSPSPSRLHDQILSPVRHRPPDRTTIRRNRRRHCLQVSSRSIHTWREKPLLLTLYSFMLSSFNVQHQEL